MLPNTSQIPPVPEEQNTSNELNDNAGLGNEVMGIPGNEDSFSKISYPFVVGFYRLALMIRIILLLLLTQIISLSRYSLMIIMDSSLHLGVKKMDEKSNMLQRRVSQMETELSSPFMAPNIEMMEKNGMF